MKNLNDEGGPDRHNCPEHGHSLVNVHKIREGRRVVIGQTCPEPRCQYSEMTPRALDQNATFERAAI